MRVLIAEDDVALASFVQKGLEAEHYAVDVSHDGEQARAMAGELDYDLLMLDMNMQHMDGMSILRQLRMKKPSLPILVVPKIVLTVADLKLDRVERRVVRGDRQIELTAKEFSLLEYLMLNAGRRVTPP